MWVIDASVQSPVPLGGQIPMYDAKLIITIEKCQESLIVICIIREYNTFLLPAIKIYVPGMSVSGFRLI